MSIKIFFFVFFVNLKTWSLSLETIFQADNADSLKSSVKKYKEESFLKKLCEKQKTHKNIPTACYKLSLKSEFWCLRLVLKDLNIEQIEKALKLEFLSDLCRQHLKRQKRILIYRKKDFFIPELKKHWTERKRFP